MGARLLPSLEGWWGGGCIWRGYEGQQQNWKQQSLRRLVISSDTYLLLPVLKKTPALQITTVTDKEAVRL